MYPADSLSTNKGVVDMVSFSPQNPFSAGVEKIRKVEKQREKVLHDER